MQPDDRRNGRVLAYGMGSLLLCMSEKECERERKRERAFFFSPVELGECEELSPLRIISRLDPLRIRKRPQHRKRRGWGEGWGRMGEDGGG